ncbi:soluble calcium-activated nucleotidase 1 [Cephus cinctus]|uniref:Apyrase n=1 Tax=Cephus cinctus TaxID=211228 RepID=A0AAJ7BNW7_CEPCN|nr:soluble calcium-activated nucleotidase 1 [Cephus cinctus]
MTQSQVNETSSERMVSVRDWRQALRTPHVYRVGNSAFRIQSLYLVFFVFIVLVITLFYTYPSMNNAVQSHFAKSSLPPCRYYKYNKTYPLTAPTKTSIGISYKIAIISDLDHASKSVDKKDTWLSYLKKGHLMWFPNKNVMSVSWDNDMSVLSSSFAMKGRGMELSELVTFDGKLVTFDDRTGMIYYIEGDQAYPWVILMDGNGKDSKGFKSEWATVKDEQLYVGSMGKEWTTAAGEFVNNNPQWVKTVSVLGEKHSLNWVSNYNRLRQAYDIEFPGYMIHESAAWSDIHRSWFFLPRRCSKDRYNETKDEFMGCNIMLIADENFLNIKVTKVGNLIPTRGFSSFKFLPKSKDSVIVALKTEENQGHTATYIMAFGIDGTIVMPELKVIDKKFEGLEFI